MLLIIIVGVFTVTQTGCSQSQNSPTPSLTEPTIPANYQTYADEIQSFSISYPPDWENAQSVLDKLGQSTKDYIKSIDSNLPVEQVSMLFMAGLKVQGNYLPNVNVVVEPSKGIGTSEQLATAEINGIKAIVKDYSEFSRIKTTVGGKDAYIIEYVCTYNSGKVHDLSMFMVSDKAVWIVTCTSTPQDINKWNEDFQSIVRSLRILK